MLIGLMGLAGSGKSTVGNILKNEYGFVPLSFAGSLKDAVSAVFGWPRHLLEGDTVESREFREVPDEYWSEAFGKPMTPRYVLQYAGTEVFRNWLNDIWIRSVGKKIQDKTKSYVITDMRFYNEINFVKNMDGFIVQVVHNNPPAWCSLVEDISISMPHVKDVNSVPVDEALEVKGYKIHRSEWEHVFWRRVNIVDYVLANDFEEKENASSMAMLGASVSHMVRLFTGPKDDKALKNIPLDNGF